jgi:hypothetical protein
MTKAALLLAMVSGFMLAAGAANAATLPKGGQPGRLTRGPRDCLGWSQSGFRHLRQIGI